MLHQQQHNQHQAAPWRNRRAGNGQGWFVPGRRQAPRAIHTATSTLAAGRSLQQLDQLLSWARSKGASVDKVAAAPNLDQANTGSLVAAKDLGTGEAVLSISDSLWLNAASVRKVPQIGAAVAALEPCLQIALFLMHSQHQRSEWAPYTASLPQHPSTPLFWSPEQQALLQGSQVADNAAGYRAFFQAKYNELFGPQGLLPASQFPREVYTYARFEAAVAMVRSRSHAPLEGDALGLVPLADAVAHRRQGNSTWRMRQSGTLLPFGKAGQSLVLEATRTIRKGEQLTMDFAPGELDSAVLLNYGELDTADPKPGYSLSLALDPQDRLLDDKLDVVENNQAAVSAGMAASVQFSITPGAPPSEAMMGFLRLTSLKGTDAFLLEPVFSNDVWSFMCEPVSEANEADVCDRMIQGARVALERYPGSIDQDLALLGSGTLRPGSPEATAVRVRLGEREALDGMLQWFEARKSTLKRLSYYQERRLRRLGLIDEEGRMTYDSFFEKGIA